jgi:Phage stabilisation protein
MATGLISKMAFRPVPVVGGCYSDDTRPYSQQDCINWIPEPAEAAGGRSDGILRQAPGLSLFSSGTGVVRGLRNVEGALFAVIDTALYKVATDGSKTNLGTIAGTGRCSLTHNQISGGNEVVIVNGSQGYVYNTASGVLTQIDDPSFEGSIITGYLNQFVLHVEPQRRYWFHSDLADAGQYISTDRYEGESNPDRMVSLVVDHQEVWIFNERSIDIFVNTGNESATFERATGTSIEIGCAATFCPAKTDNSLFWLGNDGIFYRANGYNPQRISTHAIEQAVAELDWEQCFSMVYEDRGHKVVYWTFPDGQTWGYDVSSQLWHRRKSYGYSNWRVNHLVYWNGKWIAGDSLSGNLYEMDWDEYTENGSEIERVRVTSVMHADQNRIRVPGVELVVSVGLSDLDNSDYFIDLSWSDDGGYTYSNIVQRSLGSQGSYYTRLLWRRLGITRNRVFKIAVSSPVKVDVIAASLIV